MTEKEFMKLRVGFAIVNGKVIYQENREPVLQWMKNSLKLSDEQIYSTIRGGIFKHHINFFIGVNYSPANLSLMPGDVLLELIKKHDTFYGECPVEIRNGAYVGEIGTEWEPVERIITLQSVQ